MPETISIASISDVDEIMEFIDNEWKKNHILGLDKNYFLYEYKNNDQINFVISKKQSDKINGIIGFLKSSQGKNATIWTTMWKVSESRTNPMLGVNLLNFLRNQGYKKIMSNGINKNTEEIYKYLGFYVNNLDHYFVPNNKINDFKIAVISPSILKKKFFFIQRKEFVFKKLNLNEFKKNFKFDNCSFQIPYKDLEYFVHKFYQNPIYTYDVYGIFNQINKIIAMTIVRICKYKNSKCMRIVDYYGDESVLNDTLYHLKGIMDINNYEYIDMYCFGLKEEIILKAGFLKIQDQESKTIIPNYFEPFVQNNICLKFFTDFKDLKNLRVFKADGDQDRPNTVNSYKII